MQDSAAVTGGGALCRMDAWAGPTAGALVRVGARLHLAVADVGFVVFGICRLCRPALRLPLHA